MSAEPGVDSFSDGSPAGLEHHVVTHVGEEFCFGAICACRCKYFFSGVGAVIIGALGPAAASSPVSAGAS